MQQKIQQFKGICIFIVFAFLTLYSSAAFSAVPEIINYQGSLSDAGDNPVNATLNITFTLYDVDAGPGTTLWQETQSVTVTNGQFSVELGADGGNPLPALLDDPLFLGVQVDADAEMTPRQKFTSTAFALRAKTVESDTLNSLSCAAGETAKSNGSIWECGKDSNTTYSAGSGLTLGGTTFLIPANGINISHLAPNSVGASEIVDNAVGTLKVQDNSLTASDLATGSVGTSEVQDNSLTEDDLAANSVGSSEIVTGAVTTSELASGAVNFVDLNNNAKGVGSGGVLVVPAAAFTPQNDLEEFQVDFLNSYIYPRIINSLFCIWAPAQLPNLVTVTQFDIIVRDNSVAQNVNMELRQGDIAGPGIGTTTIMASATSSGVSSTAQTFSDLSIINPDVNAIDNQYYVSGCWTSDGTFASNTALYAIRIFYN